MRYRQEESSGAVTYYLDKLMEIESLGTAVDYRHYIGDVVIVAKTGSLTDPTPGYRYTFRDRLGSIAAMADESGYLPEYRGFDAYGKPRNGDWTDKSPPTINSTVTDRGFTDHEHLDEWQLIHMNGRGFDYNLGRFISVDPFIAEPGNSQAINPYSYILNNPLSGTDPSGYCAAATGTRIKKCANIKVTSVDAGSGDRVSEIVSVNKLHGADVVSKIKGAMNRTNKANGLKSIQSAQAFDGSGALVDQIGSPQTVAEIKRTSGGATAETKYASAEAHGSIDSVESTAGNSRGIASAKSGKYWKQVGGNPGNVTWTGPPMRAEDEISRLAIEEDIAQTKTNEFGYSASLMQICMRGIGCETRIAPYAVTMGTIDSTRILATETAEISVHSHPKGSGQANEWFGPGDHAWLEIGIIPYMKSPSGVWNVMEAYDGFIWQTTLTGPNAGSTVKWERTHD